MRKNGWIQLLVVVAVVGFALAVVASGKDSEKREDDPTSRLADRLNDVVAAFDASIASLSAGQAALETGLTSVSNDYGEMRTEFDQRLKGLADDSGAWGDLPRDGIKKTRDDVQANLAKLSKRETQIEKRALSLLSRQNVDEKSMGQIRSKISESNQFRQATLSRSSKLEETDRWIISGEQIVGNARFVNRCERVAETVWIDHAKHAMGWRQEGGLLVFEKELQAIPCSRVLIIPTRNFDALDLIYRTSVVCKGEKAYL